LHTTPGEAWHATFFASRARNFKEQSRSSLRDEVLRRPIKQHKTHAPVEKISLRSGLELPGSVPKGEPRADRNPTDRIGNINSELSFSIKYNPAAIGELDQLEAQPEVGAEEAF
jgi:hypothetical protein